MPVDIPYTLNQFFLFLRKKMRIHDDHCSPMSHAKISLDFFFFKKNQLHITEANRVECSQGSCLHLVPVCCVTGLLSSGAGGLGGWAQHRKAAPSTWDLITANHFTLEVTDEGPGVPCSSPVRKDREG